MNRPTTDRIRGGTAGAILILLLVTWTPVYAEITYRQSGPFCGVYAVYTAAGVIGHPIQIESLLSSKYIGSPQGSTLDQLCAAIQDNGMFPLASAGLDANALCSSGYPAILHVRASDLSETYDHYVLCLQAGSGFATIYDAPKAPEQIPLYQLSTMWDGTAVFVSPTPLNTTRVYLSQRLHVAISLILLITVLWLWWRYRPTFSKPYRECCSTTRSLAQASALLCASIGFACGHHLWSAAGLLTKYGLALPASNDYGVPKLYPTMTADQLREAMRRGEHLRIVDARYPKAYASGHIPGAVNISPYDSYEDRATALADLPKEEPIVVYCEGEHCPLSQVLARELTYEGLSRVLVLDGGWQAWELAGKADAQGAKQ